MDLWSQRRVMVALGRDITIQESTLLKTSFALSKLLKASMVVYRSFI